MKTEKEIELSGMTGFKDKPSWTLKDLLDYLAKETPAGWVVESFRVTVVPKPKAGGPVTKKKGG